MTTHYDLNLEKKIRRGPKGVKGPTGVIGPTGLQGIPGYTGPTGLEGNRGQIGATGIRGDTGVSVFGQIGDKGDTGLKGSSLPSAKGYTGVAGDKGAPGSTGVSSYKQNSYISSLSTFNLVINNSNDTLEFNPTNTLAINRLDNGTINSFSLSTTVISYSSYLSKLWLAVSRDSVASSSIQYSIDGSNWSNNFNPIIFSQINGIAYGNGLFVAVGNGQIYGDGSNWSNNTTGGYNLQTGYIGNAVAYGNGMWVAAFEGVSPLNTLIYSSNAINWYRATLGGFNYNTGIGVAYGNGLWVAVGAGESSNNSILYSSNASNWYNIITGGFDISTGSCVNYGNGLWVAGADSGSGSSNTIQYSSNGSDWYNSCNSINMTSIKGLAYGNNLWVAVGEAFSTGIKTTILYGDGSNWSNVSGGFSNRGYSVSYNDGLWVAVGDGSSRVSSILYSTNGSNWNSIVTGGFYRDNQPFAATYNGRGVAYRPLTNIISYRTPLININSNTSLNLVDGYFSLTYSSLTLNFTPKLMSNLIELS